jgi:addiction module RelE/StbE family toxin
MKHPPYRLRFFAQVHAQLRRLPEHIQREATGVILDLRVDPYPPQTEELRDHFVGIWKIKVNGWRIFYSVNEQDKIVTIRAVKRRTRNTYTSIP